MHARARVCRRDADTEAVYMSGHPLALYFWVLQRHSVHGEAELRKVAGYWQAQCRFVCNLQSPSLVNMQLLFFWSLF